MYTIRLPFFLRLPIKNLIWRLPQEKPTVYLTFDDGPIPEVTPSVLKILQQEDIKATFFCVGENVFKYPQIYNEIIEQGHSIGQHTFNHTPAFKHSTKDYIDNINKAKEYVKSDLFRPPHGQIRLSLIQKLKRQYRIIMWDVLSGDFDQSISPDDCLSNILKKTRNGSIIVFHDSLKAQKNMLSTLPKAIRILKEKGYTFKPIIFPPI